MVLLRRRKLQFLVWPLQMSVTYGLTNKHIHRIALPLTRFLINCFILICKGNVERVARDVGKLYYQLRPGPGLADRKLGPVHEVSSRYFKGTLATKNCTSVLGLIRYLLDTFFVIFFGELCE